VHYVFEPGTFIPVAQAVRHAPIKLMGQPDYSGEYSLDEDPLWNHKATALPFDALAWYQCDHLGTPQELTDSQGNMAWTAQYKAWGQVTEQRSEWARQHGVTNPIRFQGQYHDHETGLHYNRYRYYDPRVGRFISQDPIGFAGGINIYQYAPNANGWIDPLGLVKGTNEKGQVTSRGGWRKASVRDAWNSALPGPNGGKICPVCETEVEVAPGTGPRDWDMDHHPDPWSKRDFPDGVSRKEVLDNYQTGVILKCPSCNRREGNRK
jgi:RHS repeat-associated protein